MRPFPEAVAALEQAVRAAAGRVHVDLEETTPDALGWRSSRERCPARLLTLMAPSGAARAYGLLPREGTYTALPSAPAASIAVGPDLVIVGAQVRLEAALTLDDVRAAAPLLDRAAAPLLAWDEVVQGRVETPFVRGAVDRLVAHPHCLVIDVAPGGSLDLEAAWRAGHSALVWRTLREGGELVPFTISIAPQRR